MIRQLISVCLFVAALLFIDRYFTFVFGLTLSGLLSYFGASKMIKCWWISSSYLSRKQSDQNRQAFGSVQMSDERTLGDSQEFCGTFFSHQEEMRTFVHRISQRYIQSWYYDISQSEDVLAELNYVLEDILITAYNTVTRMNIVDISERVIYLYSQHFLSYLQALETVKRNTKCRNVLSCVGMENEIQSVYKMSHPALRDKVTEWCYQRSIVATVIDLLWPQEFLGCQVAYNMLEEILTSNVLSPLIDMFSDPQWLNEMMVLLLSDDDNHLSERKHSNSQQQTVDKNNEMSKTFLLPSQDFCEKWSETDSTTEEPISDNLQLLDVPACMENIRRHSDSQINTCPNVLSSSFSYNHLPVGADFFQKLSTVPQSFNYNQQNPTMESCSSCRRRSAESEWEIWSNELTEEEKIIKISYYHDDMSQSNQNIENICRKRKSKSECERRTEFQENSLKRSQSIDCISHLTPPVSHSLSLSGSNPNLDAIRISWLKSVPNSVQYSKKKDNGFDIEIAEEAIETTLPDLFKDVQIFDTHLQEEPGRGPYVLYCIQYSGLFVNNNKDEGQSQFLRHNVFVKRRFREFLTLQSRLEENSKLKKYLKKIKGPNKWLGSLFPSLDKKTIDERKEFLQNYLCELCSFKAIAASSELQEFLAYGRDANIAYVRRISEIGVPRIDKILYKGVMGTIDLIKTALSTQNEINNRVSTHKGIHQKSLFLPVFGKAKVDSFQQHMEVKYIECNEPDLIQRIAQYVEKFDINSSEGSIEETVSLFNKKIRVLERSESVSSAESPFTSQVQTNSETLDTHNSDEASFQQDLKTKIPLANVVIELYVNSIKSFLPLAENRLITGTLKILFGQFLNRWLEKEICDLFSYKNCVHYLHLLHLALWPEDEVTDASNKQDQKSQRTEALAALQLFLPDILREILGKGVFTNSTLLLHDSLQYSQLNRCLIYHLLDYLMDHLCLREDPAFSNM